MEEKKNVSEFELKDEQLDAASGGTAAEIAELKQLLGVDDDKLFDALKKVGVDGYMMGDSNSFKNIYYDNEVKGGQITHEELVKRINIYKKTHPLGIF
jgi:hypothetical protein